MEKMIVEDAENGFRGQISASLFRMFSLWVMLLSQLHRPKDA